MTLSTHVLDTALGQPAAGVGVRVERLDGGTWRPVSATVTDGEGRATGLVAAGDWGPGRWRLLFDTGGYLGADAFWPQVTVELAVDSATHCHVPLLLAAHGYTTYRGS